VTAAVQVLSEQLDWWERGEDQMATALGRLADEDFAGPTLLPGWDRSQLLAHVARNADALINLLTWARTGVETPMYASPEARSAGISDTASLAPHQVRTEVREASRRLAEAVHGLPTPAWSANVRTAHGRTVPAAQVPWMRSREVWVHAADLDADVTFPDVPDDVLAALVDDVFVSWHRRGAVPDVTIVADDRQFGTGSLVVAGTLPAATAWVTGRSRGEDLQVDAPLPTLAAWL